MHSSDASSQQPERPAQSLSAMRQSSSRAGRPRSEESWIDLASQPSTSSLSSAAEDIVTTGLRVEQMAASRRRRPRTATATNASSKPQAASQPHNGGETSSQEEFEESESESDRVMTSSNEGLVMAPGFGNEHAADNSDDDENRTAVNYPIRNTNGDVFTPQPNAFSHPPTTRALRHASEPCPGSYFPQMSSRSASRPLVRHSLSSNETNNQHSPYNMISPSHNAAAHHDAALRASLSTLLSCAAAARGLSKSRPQTTPITTAQPSTRINHNTLRLVPESALPSNAAPPRLTSGPSFLPTIRQQSSTATSASSAAPEDDDVQPAQSPDNHKGQQHKRKARTRSRNASKERHQPRASSSSGGGTKKPRRSPSASSSSASTVYGADDMLVSPTLLTWVVSAGVVVVLSAISFTAGYAVGHEAGRVEGSLGGVGASVGGSCAGEAGRSGGLGLRRLRFAEVL